MGTRMGNRSKVTEERRPEYVPSSSQVSLDSCCSDVCTQPVNYISCFAERFVATSKILYKYWQQTPSYAKLAVAATLFPFMILPILSLALVLPFILTTACIFYCFLRGPTAFAKDLQETTSKYVPTIKTSIESTAGKYVGKEQVTKVKKVIPMIG